ncbi:polysaccharide deacetylase family protein [Candidatus Woesearchaeota archaeon]|nr:polysaccharide deacetylase family protein [Candidatus Woesearchaeota archaeon]
MKHALLTVDVETDWGGRRKADSVNKGIEEELPYIMNLFRKNKVKATFFVSGNLLPKYKKNILDIKKQGHEIASHGLNHSSLLQMTKTMFISDIVACRDLFAKELETELLGFRAPQFRIGKEHLDAISSSGFFYDSSLVKGTLPGRYSNASIGAEPFKIGKLIEIPVSQIPFIRIPMGLLWMNFISFPVFRLLFKMSKKPNMLVMYMHPFDLVARKSGKSGILLSLWYRFRQKKARRTLEKTIFFLKSEGYKLTTMSDMARLSQVQPGSQSLSS